MLICINNILRKGDNNNKANAQFAPWVVKAPAPVMQQHLWHVATAFELKIYCVLKS